MTNTSDQILDIIASKAMVPRESVTLDKKLADANISSLDMMEIIFMLEDKFDIQLPFNANTQVAELETLGDLIALVEAQIQKKA